MIVHKDSHTDHAITPEQWAHILELFKDRSSFFIETIELPEGLGHVMNGLYGPSCGDAPVPEGEVYYAPRPPRVWKSRMTKMLARPTRFIRVIAGPHEEKCLSTHVPEHGHQLRMGGCNGTGKTEHPGMHAGAAWHEETCARCDGLGVIKFDCILYTAYGVSNKDMPAAPKEPADIRKQLEELHDKRAGLHDMSPEYKVLNDQIIKLREARTVADAFWAEHALATEAA